VEKDQTFIVRCRICGHLQVAEGRSLDLLKAQLAYQTVCPAGHPTTPFRLPHTDILSADGYLLYEGSDIGAAR
jgi:hypothetical protein